MKQNQLNIEFKGDILLDSAEEEQSLKTFKFLSLCLSIVYILVMFVFVWIFKVSGVRHCSSAGSI